MLPSTPKEKSKKRRQLAIINEICKALSKVDCQFFACPGVDKRYANGRTCYACYTMQQARKLKKLMET